MIVGCLFAAVVAWFIIVACAATLHTAGKYDIDDAADAAQALRPLAGEYAYLLFAAGLFNASLFAASILPISTAYAVCEGLGFESGLDKRFHEAPAFYWLYTLLIVVGAGVLLVPRFPLFTSWCCRRSSTASAAVRADLRAAADQRPRADGRVHATRAAINIVAWITVVVMIGLTIAMLIAQMRG